MMKDVDRSVIEKSKNFDVITCYYQLPRVGTLHVGNNDSYLLEGCRRCRVYVLDSKQAV